VEKIEVELYSDAINSPVLRIPTRNFPGILIQGDSLSILADLASEIVDQLAAGDISEATDAAEELKQNVLNRIVIYERALKEHGMKLPYAKR